MRIIASIEDEEVIKKVLKHMGLWQIKQRPSIKGNRAAKATRYSIDCSVSQVLPSDKWLAEGHDFSVIDPVYQDAFPS
ncbi:MAG: hypothetical protein JRJ09_08725 [Deltaproteobacteria bacterium]|nr:hypothetical protein [Deltaproteobacteria bacterium]MBW2048598.1 hypothetical protein [Deltaproteobacteria bacterium]MBW2112945.1 hypothetical protein [Deltaproteobacteria bacterium]MBW2353785.1 hypothetical protein [Deltaproteobacteria bacterium]